MQCSEMQYISSIEPYKNNNISKQGYGQPITLFQKKKDIDGNFLLTNLSDRNQKIDKQKINLENQ